MVERPAYNGLVWVQFPVSLYKIKKEVICHINIKQILSITYLTSVKK